MIGYFDLGPVRAVMADDTSWTVSDNPGLEAYLNSVFGPGARVLGEHHAPRGTVRLGMAAAAFGAQPVSRPTNSYRVPKGAVS